MEHNKASGRSGVSPSQLYSQKPLTLKHGQVVLGLVEKRISEQKALMRIGGQTITVNLPIEISEGSKRWFRVFEEGKEVGLKPVNERNINGDNNKPAEDAKNLSLNTFKDNRHPSPDLSNGPPSLKKDQLAKASEWVAASADKERALSIIKLMTLKSQPFSDAIFTSYERGLQGTDSSIQSEMNRLLGHLSREQSPAALQVLNTIKKIQQPIQSFMARQMTAELFALLTKPSSPLSGKEAALNSLKQLEALPHSATLSNWSEGLMKAYLSAPDPANAFKMTFAQLNNNVQQNHYDLELYLKLAKEAAQLTLIGKSAADISNQVIKRLDEFASLLKTVGEGNGLISPKQLFERMVDIQAMTEISQKPLLEPKAFVFRDLHLIPKDQFIDPSRLKMNTQSSSVKDVHDLLRSVLIEAENRFNPMHSSGKIADMIKGTISLLGIDYESRLTGYTQSIEAITESLKPQLITLLRDPHLSSSVKEAAEHLTNRLNGQQILSSESGTTAQIFLQLPLHFKNKLTDITMQWTAKKQKDGRLDSDHARVLFYINLENLKETVIDMNVQKRIVSVEVYTRVEGLHELGDTLKPSLKSSLEKADYHLSSLKFLSAKQGSPPAINPEVAQINSFYEGVDIRV
ncbi:hypothetical protein [Jeotgalibacillus campisalis]|uniref:Flagellar hook-length control protein-like C-terminal domain-containing protein n=1 Tax=Jeotgalibacillus campisalis TaxID=220754 RepID=A0A0C2S0X3_9BACL|nr:hypothetical protein [Jeotgalibacillus campisalis]KIL47699.1 hypothetical protein KR50_18660 [Jeotgalibacillus campisalis]